MMLRVYCKRCGFLLYDSSKDDSAESCFTYNGSLAYFIRNKVHNRFASHCPRCGRRLTDFAEVRIKSVRGVQLHAYVIKLFCEEYMKQKEEGLFP